MSTAFHLNRGMAVLAMGAAALLAAAVPAHANTLEQIQQQKTLRVAIDLNAPPTA